MVFVIAPEVNMESVCIECGKKNSGGLYKVYTGGSIQLLQCVSDFAVISGNVVYVVRLPTPFCLSLLASLRPTAADLSTNTSNMMRSFFY